MEDKIKPEVLESGKVLIYLKMRLQEAPWEENALAAFLSCLRDSRVWVPVHLQMEEGDLEQFMKAGEGDEVTTREEVRMEPDTLRDRNGALYFPIFSQREQIPEDYGMHFSLVAMPALQALDMAHGTKDVVGLVLDGFTKPLPLPMETADLMRQLPSRLEEEQGET